MFKQILYFFIIISLSFASFFYIRAKANEVVSDIQKTSLQKNYFNVKKILKTAHITTPSKTDKIISPLKITGSVSGHWFFEGEIVGKILDENRKVLGQGPLSALDDWMTSDNVFFEGIIPFDKSSTKKGFVVIEADDPRGMGQIPSFEVGISFDDSSLACVGDECAYMCGEGTTLQGGFCVPQI